MFVLSINGVASKPRHHHHGETMAKQAMKKTSRQAKISKRDAQAGAAPSKEGEQHGVAGIVWRNNVAKKRKRIENNDNDYCIYELLPYYLRYSLLLFLTIPYCYS